MDATGLDRRPNWDLLSQTHFTWMEASKGVPHALIISCLLRCASLFLCLLRSAGLSHILLSIIVIAHDSHSGNLVYEQKALPAISYQVSKPTFEFRNPAHKWIIYQTPLIFWRLKIEHNQVLYQLFGKNIRIRLPTVKTCPVSGWVKCYGEFILMGVIMIWNQGSLQRLLWPNFQKWLYIWLRVGKSWEDCCMYCNTDSRMWICSLHLEFI